MEKKINFKCHSKEIISKFIDMSEVCDIFSDFCGDIEYFIKTYGELEEDDIKSMEKYVKKINEIKRYKKDIDKKQKRGIIILQNKKKN